MNWISSKTPPDSERQVLIVRRKRWEENDTVYDLGHYSHMLGYWRPRGSNGNFNDEVYWWMELPDYPRA
jgi:hypothetical protein